MSRIRRRAPPRGGDRRNRAAGAVLIVAIATAGGGDDSPSTDPADLGVESTPDNLGGSTRTSTMDTERPPAQLRPRRSRRPARAPRPREPATGHARDPRGGRHGRDHHAGAGHAVGWGGRWRRGAGVARTPGVARGGRRARSTSLRRRLGLQPPVTGRRGGPRGSAWPLHGQGRLQPGAQALQGQLAVAGLAADVRGVARTTGPARAEMRRWSSSPRTEEASTSKMASTREAVTFACWPPRPEERLVRRSTSLSGITTPRPIGSPSRMAREPTRGAASARAAAGQARAPAPGRSGPAGGPEPARVTRRNVAGHGLGGAEIGR